MLETINGAYNAELWFESSENEYKIHLSAKIKMSLQKREELLKASSSGKNAAYSGVMDRVREEMEIYGLMLEENAEDSIGTDIGVERLIGSDNEGEPKTAKEWRLSEYKGSLSRQSDSQRIAAWDELERSIVANIANDVSAGIRNDNVEMVISMSVSE